jgi:hypothetical protein
MNNWNKNFRRIITELMICLRRCFVKYTGLEIIRKDFQSIKDSISGILSPTAEDVCIPSSEQNQ